MSIAQLYTHILSYDVEAKQLMRFVQSIVKPQDNARILDVACGYGRYLRQLQNAKYHVLGVEINSEIANKNRSNGLNCITVEEFKTNDEQFDLIIMSHIIEHFTPQALKDFLEFYLDRLKIGGHLIIATPLMSAYFYDDFDHIKPYQPTGIISVFGQSKAQVQYYSKNRLQLCDLWFRRGFYKFTHCRGLYLKTSMTWPLRIINFLGAFLYRISFGLAGHVDGWVGVFKKCM